MGRGKESGDEHRGVMGRTDRTSPRRGGAPTAPTAPAPGCQHPNPPPLPNPASRPQGFSTVGMWGGAQRCDLLYTRVFFLVRLCVRCRGLIENGVGEKGWGVGGGCRKSKRGTYLSEFCAHQDEEEEGEELACRLHVSRAALSTLHADRRSAALRRSPRLAASSLPSRQGDFNYK